MSEPPTIAWREIPLLRLLVPFLAGIFLGYHYPPSGEGVLTSFIPLSVLGLVLLLTGGRPLRPRANLLWGALAACAMLALGLTVTWRAYELDDPAHFAQNEGYDPAVPLDWSGRVEAIRPSDRRVRVQLRVDALATPGSAPAATMGGLLAYLPRNDISLALVPGQVLHLRAEVRPLTPPLNPAGFDFAAWQARRRVYHQAFVAPGHWRIADDAGTLRGRAYRLREELLMILRRYLPAGSNELAVGSALILGKRDELSTDLRNAYAETGAVHVLAVSGLHLGFIAWGLNLLFGWGPFRRRGGRWLKLGLVLAGIWTFALVTGLPPSVQRAATMFSFLMLGRTLGRRSSVYNALGASALLLLLIDPYLLFDVGFQLSYLALLGIIFFQPRLYRWWYTPYRALDYGWRLTTVAVAAQLTTFPLSLYYFHQFPLYFMLSGLVVVVAASAILGLGIVLFLTSWWPLLAGIIGKLLYGVLWLNNAFIFRLRQLPGHLLSGVWIDEAILVLLFLTIILLAAFSLRRRARYLLGALTVLALALGINLNNQIELNGQRSWTVYHLYKETVVDAFDGRRRYGISSLPEDDPALGWSVTPYRDRQGIRAAARDADAENWYVRPPYYGFYDQRLVVVDRDWMAPAVPARPLPVNLLLLRDAPRHTLLELRKIYNPQYWIADGSNYPGQVERWQAEADTLGVSLHWTARDGAFRHKIE